MPKSSFALLAGLVAAVGLALAYGSQDKSSAATSAPPPPAAPQEMQDLQNDFGSGDNQELPPNHPAIGGNAMGQGQGMGQPPQDSVHAGLGGGGAAGGMGAGGMADNGEPLALVWKAPAGWATAPNPNPMRLATYKVPRAGADKDDTELVVSRAGGAVEANVARWASQFDGSPAPKETHKTVHDFKVTTVQIEGTYQGGMGPTAGAHPGWSMLAAIVETKGESYFFKVIGPVATVRASQKAFDAMIDGITPKS